MKKIITVIGARPQFIKAALVSRVITRQHGLEEIIIHTGQHYDNNMSDIFFNELEIPKPHHNLGMGGGNHGSMTGRQLEAIEKILLHERPDWVLVYGDTNSTLAGALAAAKLHIPVAHVEAGLRSFNRNMPEEINRILTDHIGTKLMAPTETAMWNLRAEGISQDRLELVGDVMFDASLFYRSRARKPEWFSKLGISESDYVVATIHRAENTDNADRLSAILEGLSRAGHPIILPMHPRTRRRIETHGLTPPVNLHIVEPVGYLEMIWLEANCSAVATDSGGVQKEAYFFAKPCITLRDETEWVELVENGCNTIVGADPEKIAKGLLNPIFPEEKGHIYGTGNSAEKIVDLLV
jgi:UDP-GlcNAc3NAcA epimerase